MRPRSSWSSRRVLAVERLRRDLRKVEAVTTSPRRREQARGPSSDSSPSRRAETQRAPVRWATRAGCHVDRAACAWLLRRFVDADAEFVFVEDPVDVPVGATPFDMQGVDLSHHDGDCSFETILRRYELEDPVLWDLAARARPTSPMTATTNPALRGSM